MIKEIVKDTFLLSRRCEAATLDDLQTVQDLQDTLQAHADHCVGMAANMIEIKTKDNEQDYRYVRIEVFMKEQGFQNEFDEIDATAVHITVYVDGTLAGCARCFPKEEEAAWVFGRIAVLPQFRHQGLGGVLLSEMESIVHSKKGRRCILDAQCRACAFYESYGYTICGEEHMDEHVPHVQMEKLL